MEHVEFMLTVTTQGSPTIEAVLGHQTVEALARAIADDPSNILLIDMFAKHPAAGVRRSVASHDSLSDQAVAMLAKDQDAEVRRALIGSKAFCRWIDTDTVLPMMAADRDFAVEVIYCIEDLDMVDPAAIWDWLIAHSDPSVRLAVAQARYAPIKIVRKLLDDEDHEVMLAARAWIDDR